MADQQRQQPRDEDVVKSRRRDRESPPQHAEDDEPRDRVEGEGRDRPPAHRDRDRRGPWLGGG